MSKIVPGVNDLETWCKENNREDLLTEWDYEANILLPSEVSRATNKKVSWKCMNGHKWEANPNSRTRGNKCPYCTNRKILVGYNDLTTTHPEIAKEWNYELNEDLLPTEFTFGSAQKVYWTGKCNHTWIASISHRTNRGDGCPICYNRNRTSFPEQTIYYYVKQWYPDAINNDRKILDGKELDIYIPSRKIAIEYDGEKWHENKTKDELKNKLCSDKGIVLYRIRERNCWFWPEDEYLKLIPCDAKDINSLRNAINVLNIMIGKDAFNDYNILKDKQDIKESYIQKVKNKSLEELYPEIACQWNYLRNGNLKPNMFTKSSSEKVWWIDELGHEWEAPIHVRTRGSRCPYCSIPARSLLVGFNDFETKHPDIAKEWDYEENDTIPSNVLYGSTVKYKWICSVCNNKYEATPANRHNGTGCKVCGHNRTNAKKYKKVRNIDTDEVFMSLKHAAQTYGLQQSLIGACCRKKRNTTGGYHWEYITTEGD